MEKIEVQLSSGHGLVWTHDWVVRLRRDHRIVGALVGADARFPRQEAGLPLLLSEEEIRVLLEEEVIRLVYLPRLAMPPNQDVKEKVEKYDEDSYQKQIQVFKKERVSSILSYADIIVEGKRKKMLQTIKKQRLNDSDTITEEPTIEIDKEKVIEEEVAKIQTIKKEHQVIQIFTQDPWIANGDKLEARLPAPTTDLHKCRLLTFKTLWKKGYYIGEGSKFGGDYLVYLGDPLKFHASYIVVCLDNGSHDSMFRRPQDVVAKSRLGGQTHKTFLVAKLTAKKDSIIFTSIRRNHAKRQIQYTLTIDDGDDYSDEDMQEECTRNNDNKNTTDIDASEHKAEDDKDNTTADNNDVEDNNYATGTEAKGELDDKEVFDDHEVEEGFEDEI
jgi:tRNA-splicing endonuclease subunit Sen34